MSKDLIERLRTGAAEARQANIVHKHAIFSGIDAVFSEAAEALAAAEAERKRYDMALQSLTPGGSEYVSDPERCVEHVRERLHAQHDLIKKWKLAKDVAERDAEYLRETVLPIKNQAIADAERDRDEWRRRADEKHDEVLALEADRGAAEKERDRLAKRVEELQQLIIDGGEMAVESDDMFAALLAARNARIERMETQIRGAEMHLQCVRRQTYPVIAAIQCLDAALSDDAAEAGEGETK